MKIRVSKSRSSIRRLCMILFRYFQSCTVFNYHEKHYGALPNTRTKLHLYSGKYYKIRFSYNHQLFVLFLSILSGDSPCANKAAFETKSEICLPASYSSLFDEIYVAMKIV